MQFNTGNYYHPMDREYNEDTSKELGFGVKDIGMSVPMGIAAGNVQGVAAKIRQGAGNLEIQFPGTVRGQRQAQTPGMYGKDTREALKELATINEIKLSTHSAFGVMGLSGLDQQGNFSDEQRKLVTDEIKRAIEFAADTAGGGSVVVHTGEFERPISEEPWAKEGQLFRHFEEEPEKAVIRVIDNRTGQIVEQVRKNQLVARAVWNRYNANTNEELWEKNNGDSYTDANGQIVNPRDYIDYEGNLITDERVWRVPAYDPETGRFKTKINTWDDFVEEADEMNITLAKKRGMSVEEFEEKYPNDYLLPEEAFIKASLQTNEGHSRGWALQYAQGFERDKKILDGLRKAKEFWKSLDKEIPEDEKWRIMRQNTELSQYTKGILPTETEHPLDMIDKELKEVERRMEYSYEASVSQEQQAENSRVTQEHVMSSRKYALDRARKSYVEAAIHAYDQTHQKNLEKPLMITMENIFPERYGGHPEELKGLVMSAREGMKEKLIEEKHLSEAEASKAAETHIKATVDTGHFNMWRKYYQGSDEDFRKWLLDEVQGLADSGIIGNVHLTDNFGYQDDHLAPGQGTTPVLEIAKILKKSGYKGPLTVEPGADASTDLSDFHGLMKTWKLFGSPVYGLSGPVRPFTPQRWGDIQYSYFGQNKPPYYVFGAYSPSNDWTFWSGVQLE